jgi:hypothetical protein
MTANSSPSNILPQLRVQIKLRPIHISKFVQSPRHLCSWVCFCSIFKPCCQTMPFTLPLNHRSQFAFRSSFCAERRSFRESRNAIRAFRLFDDAVVAVDHCEADSDGFCLRAFDDREEFAVAAGAPYYFLSAHDWKVISFDCSLVRQRVGRCSCW